jgi:hypothetical protein
MAKAKSEQTDRNTVVILNLDRPRKLRYGHMALKKMLNILNTTMDEFNLDNFSMDELETILWCGLTNDAIEHGEDLKLEDMEKLLDQADSFGEIIIAMNKAINFAFMQTEKN